MPAKKSKPLVVTMGEPAGVGPELVLQTWHQRSTLDIVPFCYIGCSAHLKNLGARLGLSIPLVRIEEVSQAGEIFSTALPVLERALPQPVTPGKPQPSHAKFITAAIDCAVDLTLQADARAMVTNPIHKKTLHEAGFSFPGHTEYLAHLAGKNSPVQSVMMLAIPGLKVVPVTVHLPLAQVSRNLTREKIISTARITARALHQDFAIPVPRLAVAALNPHAGERGQLGREEIDIITPAVNILRTESIQIEGPFPADTLFSEDARRAYDAVLCMYHDQALIPLKTIDFYRGANVTLGLPFVRTSPDHGTAFDIAGQGTARIDSFVEALVLADQIARRRMKS